MPSYFEWDPSTLALGVAEMDREHQTLVGCMNRLHVLHAAGASRAELGRAVDTLARFTVKHFADEEAYMARVGFAEPPKDALVHKDLLAKVGAHVAAFQKTGKLTDAFFAFLKMWLKAHICGVDAKYAKRSAAA